MNKCIKVPGMREDPNPFKKIQIGKGDNVFHFAVTLFLEAKRDWNTVWSLGHSGEYL